MTPTAKPQSQEARKFIEALHAHRRGEITREQLDAQGQKLNGAVQLFGKP